MFLLVPAHPGRPGQRAVKRLCVCVCVCVCFFYLIKISGHQGPGAVMEACKAVDWLRHRSSHEVHLTMCLCGGHWVRYVCLSVCLSVCLDKHQHQQVVFMNNTSRQLLNPRYCMVAILENLTTCKCLMDLC